MSLMHLTMACLTRLAAGSRECCVAAKLVFCVSGAAAGRAGLGTCAVALMRAAETSVNVST